MPDNSEEKQYETCPICNSPIKKWRSKSVGKDNYNMDLCGSCGFCFVNPRPSFQFLMNYYSLFGHSNDYAGKKAPDLEFVLEKEKTDPNSTIDARRLIKTIKSLARNTKSNKFLDVGCGYGVFSKEAMGAGFDVIALELAKNEREIAKGMTGLDPIATSFEDFDCAPESVGVVFMSQILEHALDINLWIQKSRNLLVDNGIMAIALPNYGSIFRMIMQDKEPYICPPAHLNFFNPRSLSTLLEKHGFAVEAVQWVSRIPRSTFEKRMPGFGKPLLPLVQLASSASLKMIDALRLGSIINVYGRKVTA